MYRLTMLWYFLRSATLPSLNVVGKYAMSSRQSNAWRFFLALRAAAARPRAHTVDTET